jgi:hypothetical protein
MRRLLSSLQERDDYGEDRKKARTDDITYIEDENIEGTRFFARLAYPHLKDKFYF